MFRQICCSSTARTTLTDADLQAILDSAVRYNGPHGITGLLAYGGGQFFHVLEGSAEAIDEVVSHLRSDSHIQNFRVLRDVSEETRDFAGWPMAFRPMEPEAGGLVIALIPHSDLPTTAVVAALGNPKMAADLGQMRLAA